MEAVFASAYLPSEHRPDFLRRCAEIRVATSPGTVWVQCLLELLYTASSSARSPPVPTDNVLRACEASAESLGPGLEPGKSVSEHLRAPCLAVVAKICAWHHDRPPLVAFAVRLLRTYAMLPSGRLPVHTARRLCNRAVTFQGHIRTDSDADALGTLLVRIAGLGKHGATTLRKIWHDRAGPIDGLQYAVRYRNWALMAGLAEAGSGPGPPPRVSAQFDGDVWECAAAESPNEHRRNVLKHLLAQFRAAKLQGKMHCSPYKCLAMTAIDAAFGSTHASNPDLIRCVQLFVDAEHVVTGCRCSAIRSIEHDDVQNQYRMPAWGGEGSSCIAAIARRCIDLNTRRNADSRFSGLKHNPTRQVLTAVVPRLIEAVQSPKFAGAKDVVHGTVAMHTRQAVAVLAAAPFLDGDGQWRTDLLDALKTRAVYWHRCTSHLMLCGSRIVSQTHAWSAPAVMQNLVEAAAAAGAFSPLYGNVKSTIAPQTDDPIVSAEAIRTWALTRALRVLAGPGGHGGRAETRIGHTIAAIQINAAAAGTSRDAQRPAVELMTAIEQALGHLRLPELLLAGRFRGSWGSSSSSLAKGNIALIKWAERIGGPRCGSLMRREAGLWNLKPSQRCAGWWHLGPGFAKAALCFMTATAKTGRSYFLPPEIAIVVLATAAALN